MTRVFTLAGLFLASALLAGCGTSKSDRAISGGAIGAAGGAGVAAATGGNPLTGGLLGGAGGAAGGALTEPNDIDLGKPLWKR
jgi:hypothetical protein